MSLFWSKKCVRLHDNPALLAASKDAVSCNGHLIIVHVVGTATWTRMGANRRRFMHQALSVFDGQLQRLGQRLVCLRNNNLDDEVEGEAQLIVDLVLKTNVQSVHVELCSEPAGRAVHDRVSSLLTDRVPVTRWGSYTMADPRSLPVNAPLTYKSFCKMWEQSGACQPPVPTPDGQLPGPFPNADVDTGSLTLADVMDQEWIEPADGAQSPVFLEGGETAALHRMHTFGRDFVVSFEKPKSSPVAENPPSTTLLSPYLATGCLSVRTFYYYLRQLEMQASQFTKPPVSLVGQLLWREHFTYVSAAVGPGYSEIGPANPVCRPIPWTMDPVRLQAWKTGRTGFPFIDAHMRKLKHDGFLHHLARHSVACFATRGQLWLPWTEAMKVFEEYLLDYDHALNCSNWMWLSCSAFFHQYGRVYGPVSFGEKYGAEARAYVRRWVPEVRNFPDKLLFKPWEATAAQQTMAGCRIGVDYPAPIVDMNQAKDENLSKLNHAFRTKAVATTEVRFRQPWQSEPTDESVFHDGNAGAVTTAAAAAASGQKRSSTSTTSSSNQKKKKK